MSNTLINAKVIDQSMQLTNLPLVIASGSEGVIQMQIELDDKWNGYGVTAVFYRTEDEVYHVPVTLSTAIVPHEVLANEGHFYFGLIGVNENTRTTEVVRIDVKQGAIKKATNTPETPTPSIYDQILKSYGKVEQELAIERSRLNEAIAMRSTSGALISPVSDEYINGTIESNGAVAYIRIQISDLSLKVGGVHYSDYCIPPEFAPLQNYVEMVNTQADLNIHIERDDTNGWARVVIENPSNNMYSTDMVDTAETHYPLANVYIAEMADIRVGFNGTNYPTAGEAIREQIKCFNEKVDEEVAEKTKNLANAVKKTYRTNKLLSRGVALTDISPATHNIKVYFLQFDGDITQYSLLRYGADENDNPQIYNINEDKTVDEITSLYPVTTLKLKGPQGIIVVGDIEYNQDINKALENVDVPVDFHYNPESYNAQSGKAVAEAIENAIGDIETLLGGI